MHRALVSTVDQVGRVAAAEGIDCDYAKGGSVVPVYSLMIATEPGGYVGDGVAAANLAGRCLAALITGTERELTALPGSVTAPGAGNPNRCAGSASTRPGGSPLAPTGSNAAGQLLGGITRKWPRRPRAP